MPATQRKQLFSACFAVLMAVSAQVNAATKSHRVVAGDSLWSIAKQHGTSVEALKQVNSLSDAKLRVGQVLNLEPAPVAPEPKTAATAKSEVTAPTTAAPAAQTKPAVSAPADTVAPSPHAEPVVPTSEPAPRYEGELRGQLEPVPAWVLARPAAAETARLEPVPPTLHPCSPEDAGFGSYSAWQSSSRVGQLLLPKQSPLDAGGTFNLVIHFHGRELARKQWTQVMDDTVLLAVDLGIDSNSYAEAFSDPKEFRQILLAVERDVAKAYAVHSSAVGRVALSAWSAGYGAVGKIIDQPYGEERVDSVILLDGLHSGYWGDSLNAQKLAPFTRFAQRAAKEERLLFVSHSSLFPRGYASTTETARYLIWKTGGEPKPSKARKEDPMSLELLSSYSKGNFHVRGFRGSDTADHCAQAALLRDVLRIHLRTRWAKTDHVVASRE